MADRNFSDLDRLIAGLYEAGLSDDASWQPVVQGLVNLLGARTGWLILTPQLGGVSQIMGGVGAGIEAMTAYQGHYWSKDPWLEAVLRLPTGAVFASHDTIDGAAFAGTEIFADYVRPHFGETTWCSAVTVPVADGTLATFSVHRLHAVGAFTPWETRRLNKLVPHLRQALLLRHRVGNLMADRARALGALAAGAIAAFVVNAAGHVKFASPRAEAVASANDGLRLTAFGLRATTSVGQKQLDRAIALASTADTPRGTMLRLPRPSGMPDWAVLVTPFVAAELQTEAREVLCIVRDMGQGALPSESMLISALGLTQAEARLANALARGLQPEEIAVLHGVVLATVRKQLSAILAKTGSRRQADVVRLILTLPPT